jgi:hypothetical protein
LVHEPLARVEEIAEAAEFRPVEVMQTFDPLDDDPYAEIIKRVYAAVWSRLEQLGVARPDLISTAEDVWNPDVNYWTTRFAVRAYRLGGAHG